MRQVLVNLLSNAVKFCEDGTISVRVRACPPSGGGAPMALQCEVRDTGIGIAKENHGDLFQAFHQIEGSARRRYEGTGLGLPVVHGIVTSHGGTIQVDSRVGDGTRFEIRLPAGSPTAPRNP